jgi:hypothetical protein
MARTTDGTITGVAGLISLIDNSGLADRKRAHVRLWFRGHADVGWDLKPGVYRPKTFPVATEKERIELECQLNQDFKVQSAGLLEASKNDAELYFLQQHYRMPTRLLDWSLSPLAALYFAVSDAAQHAVDGALFMMDAYRLAPRQKAEDFFRGVPTSRHAQFKRALRPILDWDLDPKAFPNFILPVRPDHTEKRVALQKGCFTFHVPEHPILTEEQCDSLKCFLIPKGLDKVKLQNELFLLGIDDFAVYGDLESLSRRLKFANGIPY